MGNKKTLFCVILGWISRLVHRLALIKEG
jgi:hypothetical protein